MFTILIVGEDPRASRGGIVTVFQAIVNHPYFSDRVSFFAVYAGRLGSPLRKSFSWFLGSMSFLSLLKRSQLVHLHHSTNSNFLLHTVLLRIAKVLGKRVVLHNHAGDFHEFYNSRSETVKKWIVNSLEASDCVIVLSNSWRTWCQSIAPGGNYCVLRNPIPFDVSYVARNQSRYSVGNILLLGRLEEKKGVYDLLNVIPEVVKSFPHVRFTLAGDGNVEGVRKLVRKNNLLEYVKVPGWVDGTTKLQILRHSDIFVLPSYNEGLPMALLETMASGIVPIVTPVGGIPEVVTDKKNGLLVNPGDREGLRDAIISLVTNKGLYEKLASKAYETVHQQFSLEGYVVNLFRIYKSLIQRTRIP